MSAATRVSAARATGSASRGAVGALYGAVALELLGAAVPIVDLGTRGAVAAHLQALYSPYGVSAPDASVVVIYLVAVGVVGALVWLATIRMLRRRWRWARLFATVALLCALAIAGADLTVSEYGLPILPTWLGLVGLLPSLAGLVAVVLLWRPGTGRAT
jgi:hypothetical protein